MSLWYMETISFFCLDSEELCLSRLMLKERGKEMCFIKRLMHVCVVWGRLCVYFVLHGSFLPLLQSLPVFLQRADGVPRLAASPPQRAVSQEVLGVGFYDKYKEKERNTHRWTKQDVYCYFIYYSLWS